MFSPEAVRNLCRTLELARGGSGQGKTEEGTGCSAVLVVIQARQPEPGGRGRGWGRGLDAGVAGLQAPAPAEQLGQQAGRGKKRTALRCSILDTLGLRGQPRATWQIARREDPASGRPRVWTRVSSGAAPLGSLVQTGLPPLTSERPHCCSLSTLFHAWDRPFPDCPASCRVPAVALNKSLKG